MLLLATSLLPTIWIVDAQNGPGTDFLDLPAAVAVAQTGDTLLVRAGVYTAFAVTGKALTIRGEGAATTLVQGTSATTLQIDIGPTPADTVFAMSGLKLQPLDPGGVAVDFPALRVEAGAVVNLTDCVVAAADWTTYSAVAQWFRDGARVTGELHASRCAFHGANSVNFAASGGDGVRVLAGGRFAADASDCTGGSIGFLFFGPAYGGSGLSVQGGQASVSRTALHGGATGGILHIGLAQAGDGVRVTGGGFARLAGASIAYSGWTSGSYVTLAAGVHTDATSAARLHAPSQTVAPSLGGVPTIGNVANDIALPVLGVVGTPRPSGEVLATSPVQLTISGGPPFAPCALFADVLPNYSGDLAPFVLGEVLVPLGHYDPQYYFLDGTGSFHLTFTPSAALQGVLGFPVFLQAGVFDFVHILASNRDVHVYSL